MSDLKTPPDIETNHTETLRPPLTDAAKRALAEAEARRAVIDATAAALPREINGRGGKEPVRYGDWEVKGVATDF
jgi:hypothetical protein